jgi:hypothetical protein
VPEEVGAADVRPRRIDVGLPEVPTRRAGQARRWEDAMNWLKRETPVANWALVCFAVLTLNGLVDLIARLVA